MKESIVDSSGPRLSRGPPHLMREHALGRKRLPDMMLTGAYMAAGIGVIATLDARDFGRFPGFAPLVV